LREKYYNNEYQIYELDLLDLGLFLIAHNKWLSVYDGDIK